MLVLSEVAAARGAESDGWFGATEVDVLCESFRLPQIGNSSAALSALAKKDLVRRRGIAPAWTVTPLGHSRVLEILGAVDPTAVEYELGSHPGAEFGRGRLSVLPPIFAPARWSEAIASLLKRVPFDKNVLCMTRFPEKSDASDPLHQLVPGLRHALALHGLTLHVADDRALDDDLFSNVAAYMWACRYGVAILEDRVGRGVNGNVLIELGAMVMAGRRCLLIKDEALPKLPTDLVARIYKSADVGNVADVVAKAHVWVRDDLGVRSCTECPGV